MRVLKFSSAAVIVLLLFFASLPPSVGVEEQNHGGQSELETSQRRCGVPEIKDGVWYFIEQWHCKFPTFDWFNTASGNATDSSCTREEAADEMMKEASKELTATKNDKVVPNRILEKLNGEFRRLVEKSLESGKKVKRALKSEKKLRNRIIFLGHAAKAVVKLPFNLASQACKSLGRFYKWIKEINVIPDDENEFCFNYRRILQSQVSIPELLVHLKA